MRLGGGKQKGAQFERDVCRELSLWVSRGKQEDVFWRSAMSGGRSTVAFRKGKRLATQAGDISSVHAVGNRFVNRFLIECKFYADLNFLGLLTGKGKLMEFWLETAKQARSYHKFPMLVAKQNRMLPIVCLGSAGSNQLGLLNRALLIETRHNLRIIPLHEFVQFATRPT